MSSFIHHPFLKILRNAVVVALVTAFALAVAYQVRSRVMVDLGGKWDAPFVARFFDAEGDAEQTYRWTRSESRVELEGQGLATPWTLRVRLNGYRPNGPTRVQAFMNGQPTEAIEAHDGWDIYEIRANVAADGWNGNNLLVLSSDTFVPKREIPGSQDTRKLGVAADWLELAPTRSRSFIGSDDFWIDFNDVPVLPPFSVLLSWGVAFGMMYATARGIGVTRRGVNVAAGILIVALAFGFAFMRPLLGYYTNAFLILALVLALLGALLVFLLPRFAAYLHLTLDRTSLTVLCGIVLLSIGLKWGGAWYPQFHASDLLFHAHRLEFVSQGQLFFTSELPDAARRVVPYPPALYVALAPLLAFEQDFSGLLIVFDVLVDALAIVAIYFAARVVLEQGQMANNVRDKFVLQAATRGALLVAFLAAFNPVAFWIYSWGNHTNIFGQTVATILFAVLLTQDLKRTRNFALALLLFFLAATAHLGIFLSLLAFFPAAIVLALVLRNAETRREGVKLLALFVGGLVIVTAIYYAEFSDSLVVQTQKFLGDFGGGRAAGESALTPGRVGDVARYTLEQLGWVLLVAGMAGVPLAWKAFGQRARGIWAAWMLVGLVFALVTLGASFSTRYTVWAAPALALSGGLFLAWVYEKSQGAQFATYALCLFAFGQTLWLWLDRVWNAYH